MAVYSFEDLGDMLEHMEADRKKADSKVQPWQEAIKTGDYFKRQNPQGIAIYGTVLKNEQRSEALKNYRFVKAYSFACTKGEMGDVHVSQIEEVISKAEFDAAKRNDWRNC